MDVDPIPLSASLLGSLGLFSLYLAVPLAFMTSLVLLRIYLRAVTRSMLRRSRPLEEGTGPDPADERISTPHAAPSPTLGFLDLGSGPSTRVRRVQWPAWTSGLIYALAGLAFGVAMAAGWLRSVGLGFDALVLLMLTILHAWPVVFSWSLVSALSWRGIAAAVLIYAALFGAVAAVALHQTQLAADALANVWLDANAVPTLICLVFLAKPIRAVGPLMITLMIAATAGAILIVVAISQSQHAIAWYATLATQLGIGPFGAQVALLLAGALPVGLLGWLLMRRIGRAYQQRRVSDLSILNDAVWLIFTLEHAVTMMQRSPIWGLAPFGALLAYKAVTASLFHIRSRTLTAEPIRLLLLRVFSLGNRSERLFARFAKLWRCQGDIRMIAGPDLATSTVEPHEFLDFLSGRLQRRFIGSPQGLDARLGETAVRRDPDGRYRISDFFCHDDTWRMVLTRLAEDSDVVLMDLRGFSAKNQGCIFEINELLANVPLARCVFLVDATTHEPFLLRTFQESWLRQAATSINRGEIAPRVRLFRPVAGSGASLAALAAHMVAMGRATTPIV